MNYPYSIGKLCYTGVSLFCASVNSAHLLTSCKIVYPSIVHYIKYINWLYVLLQTHCIVIIYPYSIGKLYYTGVSLFCASVNSAHLLTRCIIVYPSIVHYIKYINWLYVLLQTHCIVIIYPYSIGKLCYTSVSLFCASVNSAHLLTSCIIVYPSIVHYIKYINWLIVLLQHIVS